MKRIALALFGLIAAASPLAAEEHAPQLKGMAMISMELASRISPPDLAFELDQFMPADGLDELAGTWSSFGTEHRFSNGTPNPVNMVILYASLSSFADAMGKSCAGPVFPLNDSFADTLEIICQWPRPEARNDEMMTAYWLAIMGYEAPREEYVAWRDFFMSAAYRDKPAAEVVSAMTLAITMNPYFLIQK